MVNLNDLAVFVQAVEHGGFAAAARGLGLPKSTLSKRVAELEASLGARLIHRTSRSFALTDAGRDFLDHARAALIEAEAAEAVVRRRLAEPTGTVRLTASLPVTQFDLAGLLPELARSYPKLRLEMLATDRFVDLVQEGFDLAVRSHFAPLPDSALIQRRLGVDPVVLVAAPAYLAERGRPDRPEALAAHDGLLTASTAATWRLEDAGGRVVQVSPNRRMVADESLVLLGAAAAGLGISCLPHRIARAHLARGELVRVLPEWTAGAVTTTLLIPHRRGELPGVRVVIEFLATRLGAR
jgi:DNA-binding transcriptional LysR family regulator